MRILKIDTEENMTHSYIILIATDISTTILIAIYRYLNRTYIHFICNKCIILYEPSSDGPLNQAKWMLLSHLLVTDSVTVVVDKKY